jgi:hypothetical protein
MQHTVTWHVDDVKSSHVNSEVNDDFEAWCEQKYGNDEIGHVKVVRGKTHDYLAMILDYNTPGAMKVDMRYYINGMIQDFPYPIKAIKTAAPCTNKLMKVDVTSKHLDVEKKAIFHTFTIKAMFLCKRGRPDVSPGVGFFTGRVKEPREQDWMKLFKVLGFLKGTRDDVLTLEADDCQVGCRCSICCACRHEEPDGSYFYSRKRCDHIGRTKTKDKLSELYGSRTDRG